MTLFNKTSNPAFSRYFWEHSNTRDNKMTVRGILLKSLLSIFLIICIMGFLWDMHSKGINLKWYGLVGMISAIVISIVISVRQQWAYFLVPLYAIAKGFFLGSFTAYTHDTFPNMPYQAIGVTVITFFVVLIGYQTRIIVVTNKVRSVIITACASIFIVYIMSWVLSFFGIKSFIWGTSWMAIGFNIVAAIFAALALLLDFDFIERYKNKASKDKEWLATWGLLVTIIWLYVEILRLMRKFAIRF